MSDQRDYLALDWVKHEIEETLKQAQQALEAYVETPEDNARLGFCVAYLHQVLGTLQMVEFYGAALLAEEMEQLAQAVQQGKVMRASDAHEVLMRAIIQLPAYLDRVKSSRKDLPVVLLPLLNDLRATRGEALLSETSLFKPNIELGLRMAEVQPAPVVDPEFIPLVKKIRQIYQVSLIGMLKDDNAPKHIAFMAKVFTKLRAISGRTALAPLWMASGAVVEGVLEGSIPLGSSVRMLLGQVDRQIKKLIEEGVTALNERPPQELFKNLLYYSAKSDGRTPLIKFVKRIYQLDGVVLSDGEIDIERQRLSGPDKEAIASVVAALTEEIDAIKDVLELFSKESGDKKTLKPLVIKLKQVADTVAVLGLGPSRKLVVAQQAVVQEMLDGQRDINKESFMDIAGALLYVEGTLNSMLLDTIQQDDEESIVEVVPDHLGKARTAVLRECRAGIERGKDSVIEFIASQWDPRFIKEVPSILGSVRGGLEMISMKLPAQLLTQSVLYIENKLLGAKEIPEWKEMDVLADAVSSVEYYLERFSNDSATTEAVLEIAKDSVAKLGYPLPGQPEPVVEVKAETSEESSALDLTSWSEEEVSVSDVVADVQKMVAAEVDQQSSGEVESEDPLAGLDLAMDVDGPAVVLNVAEEGVLVESQQDMGLDLEFEAVGEVASEVVGLDAEIIAELPEFTAEMAAEAEELELTELVVTVEEGSEGEQDDIIDDEIIEIFVEEAAEVLETLNEYFPRWAKNTTDEESLTEFRRAFHTLKGSGRMVRATVIGELAWSIESMLNRVIDKTAETSPAMVALIEKVCELIPGLINAFENRQPAPIDTQPYINAANVLSEGGQLDVMPVDQCDDTSVTGEMSVKNDSLAESDESIDLTLIEIFSGEAEGHLEALDLYLAEVDRDLSSAALDDSVLRALHTLKGSANMAGISSIAQIIIPLEKFIKELHINGFDADESVINILEDSVALSRQGLVRLEHSDVSPLDGSQEFLAVLAKLDETMLGHVPKESEINSAGVSGETGGSNINVLSQYLAEKIDAVFDADEYIARWRTESASEEELQVIKAELLGLAQAAGQANVSAMQDLSLSLLDFYNALLDDRIATNKDVLNALDVAHNELINMMDFLAAHQSIPEAVEVIADLKEAISNCEEEKNLDLDELDLGLGIDLGESALDATSSFMAQQKTGIYSDLGVVVDFDEVSEADELSSPHSAADVMAEIADYIQQPVGEVLDMAAVNAELTLSETVIMLADAESFDEELLEIFIEEADEILERANASLDSWKTDRQRVGEVQLLQRELHTLKGGARMAGVAPIGDLAHELESLYEAAVGSLLPTTGALMDLLQDCHDVLGDRVDEIKQGLCCTTVVVLLADVKAYMLDPENFERSSGSSVLDANVAFDEIDIDAVDLGFDTPIIEPPPKITAVDSAVSVLAKEVNEALIDIPQLTPTTSAQSASAMALVEDVAANSPLDDSNAEIEETIFELSGVDPDLLDIFLEEAEEILESVVGELDVWIEKTEDLSPVQVLQRDLHTLKGGARMAEVVPVGDLSHELEFLYEGLCDNRFNASPVLFELLHQCHDALVEMVEAVKSTNRCVVPTTLLLAVQRYLKAPAEFSFEINPVSDNSISSSDQEESIEINVNSLAIAGLDVELLEVFMEEASELELALDKNIYNWLNDKKNSAHENEIKRVLHTLKGGSRLASLRNLGDISHDFETLIINSDLNRDGRDAEFFEKVRAYQDAIGLSVEQVREALMLNRAKVPSLSDLPVPAPKHESGSGAEDKSSATVSAAGRKSPQEMIKVPSELLEDLVNLAGETSINRGRVEQGVSDFAFSVEEMGSTIERLAEQLRRLDVETEAQILSSYASDVELGQVEVQEESDFDPLEMDQYSQLHQLSKALSESASDLVDIKRTLIDKARDTETVLLQQSRINTELQEGLMRTRMVPFSRLVPRLRRIIRQISSELGKSVEFTVVNPEGEMDRSLLERMIAPLEHMLRNAVDHGIEDPATREASKKDATGEVVLTLSREGGEVVMTLSDDGKGIDVKAVRKKAIERGLMDKNANLTEQEIFQFIFQAGFSTAQAVTQISGRGVGMDVVASEIKQMGGNVTISSTPRKGSIFTVRLPFTVATNRALMVRVGEDTYAIPLNQIEGIVRISPHELPKYFEENPPLFEYGAQGYQLSYLGQYVHDRRKPHIENYAAPLPVLLIRGSEHHVAIQVDGLIGSREVVVKSVGAQLSTVAGLSGATILGDGSVVIILDILSSIRASFMQSEAVLIGGSSNPEMSAPYIEPQRSTPLIMVTDDSVTVRKVTTRLLERHGFDVMTAKDGVDAIEKLDDVLPDAMLLDIEMPRMDGFEVASHVRHDERLKGLPIIMITSRTGEKHRDRAFSIGVNQYMGKPFQETELLESIHELLAEAEETVH